MPEQLWFTEILNRAFASPVTALLRTLHIEPKHPATPIPNSFAMEILVFGFLIMLFLMLRARLSVDRPGSLQHVFEGVEGFVQGQSNEIIGHHSEGYTAFLATLFFFILLWQFDRCDSRLRVADGFTCGPAWVCPLRVCVLPRPRVQARWNRLPEALCRSDAPPWPR